MPKKQGGFTLIEVLVVIAIIGFLAAVIIVNLNSVRNQAALSAGRDFDSTLHNILGAEIVGEYKLDEITGGMTSDSSGYNNHGTVNGGIAQNSNCIDRGCFVFDGIDDYVTIGDVDVLDIGTEDLTVTGWIQAASGSTLRGIVGKRNSGLTSPGWQLRLMTTNTLGAYFADNSSTIRNQVFSSKSFADGKWHHFAVVFDRDDQMKIFRDGALNGSVSITDEQDDVSNTVPAQIGASQSSGSTTEYFNGRIDDIRIYQSALGLSQIQSLYARGLERHRSLSFNE